MGGKSGLLPSFGKPPVIEVVCGVQFEPVEGLLAPHLGSFWDQIRSEFPRCREVPPLIRRVEGAPGGAEVAVEWGEVPPLPRLWFIHERDNALLQIQRDMFLYNWRKVTEDDEYPRYPQVREKFADHWRLFCDFVGQRELGEITPRQYEMTYVNHIRRGQGWDRIQDLGGVIPDCAWRHVPGRFLPGPESISWRSSFAMPDAQGHLHVVVRPATHKETHVRLGQRMDRSWLC